MTARPAAAVLVDDPHMAARLCDVLRRRGYLPIAIRRPLELAFILPREHPRVELAMIGGTALGLGARTVHDFLAEELPHVARVVIGGKAPAFRTRTETETETETAHAPASPPWSRDVRHRVAREHPEIRCISVLV